MFISEYSLLWRMELTGLSSLTDHKELPQATLRNCVVLWKAAYDSVACWTSFSSNNLEVMIFFVWLY